MVIDRLPSLLIPGWKLKLSIFPTSADVGKGADAEGYRLWSAEGTETGMGTSKGEAGSSFLSPPRYAVPFTAPSMQTHLAQRSQGRGDQHILTVQNLTLAKALDMPLGFIPVIRHSQQRRVQSAGKRMLVTATLYNQSFYSRKGQNS